jgi:broad specificity phosphatase PhoE/ribonuclease HI
MRRLVVEADGGSRGNPGPAGYGALVRDGASGAVLREVAAGIGRATNNVAEYRGLIAGLTAAAELDPRAEVEVRMDSKLVVEQMSGRWKVKHADMAALAAEAAALVRRFPRVRFVHVPRERNAAADRLANAAMDAAARGRAWTPSPGPGTGPPPPEQTARPAAVAGPRAGWAPLAAPVTTLLLLRHGQTALSGERRFSGLGGVGLTDHGRAQARAAAHRLRADAPTAVVTSPLRRARETAAAVAEACRVDLAEDEDLRETDFGDWEGCTFAEVAERWPAELRQWLADPGRPPPHGESFLCTERRLRAALRRLLTGHRGGRVVVVTHVTPIKTLLRLALEAPTAALFRIHLDPGSLTVVDYGSDGAPLVRRVNDGAHLPEC